MFLFILIALAFASLLGFILWRGYRGIANRNISIDRAAVVPWPPEEVIARTLSEVAPMLQSWRYRLVAQGPRSIAFSCSYRPVWLAIPVFVFFPLGLLALIYKRTVEITFSAMTAEGDTHLRISGRAPGHVDGEIARIAGEMEAGSTGSPAEPRV